MKTIRWGAAAALLAALPAVPAVAQQQNFPPIRVGQTVNGTLAATDPKLSERGPFKVYRFDAREGQSLVLTLRSGAFDAYLTVARTVGGITDQIETDDDRGGGTDARIRFRVPATGSYLVLAQSLAEDGAGAFTLSLEQAAEPTTAQAREIRIGQIASGDLAESDAVLEDDDTFYDTWTFSGRDGQRLLIEMKSDAFDTYLTFGRMDGGEFNAISSNDDIGQGDTDSRLRVTLDGPGEYVIRANSVRAGQTGGYTLVINERPAAPATAVQQPIRPGEAVSGTLDDSDAVMEDESFYDYYVYTGRAGERLRITMESDDFDAYLAFGRIENGEFSEISSNDDGPDGTNSQLDVTLPSDGRFVIRANSLTAGNTGAYTIRLSPQQ